MTEKILKEISKRFSNGSETIEDIINYCRNYEIKFENGLELRVVEKKYFDKLVKKIKELEEENKRKDMFMQMAKEVIENSILTQKVKDILNEIQEEYNKVQEQFDCIWDKKIKDNYDRYKLQELSAMQQELGFILGKFEELLEEGK